MLIYTTGDLLKSNAKALVNTVNCEGYMGKGIAYQFKMKYPRNNEDYVKACKNGSLTVGKMHYFNEDGKIIINFPTKNKWRAKSKIEYIESGLNALVKLIFQLNITSIAIPPLGSGNGGLIWADVKALIEKKFELLPEYIKVFIYEPSQNYKAIPKEEPKLSMSALVLMEIKEYLNKFDTLRLQKTAYFMNLFLGEQYFRFKREKYGPYDNSIAIISRKIREFQDYHNVKDTKIAYDILYKKLVSRNIDNKLSELELDIKKASNYVNSIESNHDLECLATILFLIQENTFLSEEEILIEFKSWSEDKAKRFSDNDILNGINRLLMDNIIAPNLTGYTLNL
ncbi:Appr-1-p processing protein [Clostridium perfringens]|uniref:Appr-1-p processing protein n=1 Tax=Clostridium perfringens TaxID=1502 RepID=A0AAW9IHF0_CLOPF|nr:macro domain-containing protein [Clostridium perfringens]MDZ5003293.1 Appr-1-p processing protein [Clostridium perfringens]MDZ5009004.1 Appr-1-p processing protein [Clostridium perfringens]MDZ5057338.1 Appr-1-p processing protein [Clostridium perfringens]